VKKVLKLSYGWNGNTVNDFFQNWASQNFLLNALPTHICWNIWLDKNNSIFEDRPPSVQRIVYLALGSVGIMCKKKIVPAPRILSTFLLVDKVHAWFDGAAQQNGNLCGAGGVIKIVDMSKYKWTLNCVRGTNTRAELMGAWATLILALRLSILDLHVLWDSKIVINWLNGKGTIMVANLDGWKD